MAPRKHSKGAPELIDLVDLDWDEQKLKQHLIVFTSFNKATSFEISYDYRGRLTTLSTRNKSQIPCLSSVTALSQLI